MMKNIHPKYYDKAKVTCACGNTMTLGSTKEKIEVEICSNCHPFYTGKKQLVDTAGRAEKFEKRRKAKSAAANKKKDKKSPGKQKKSKKL